MSIQTFFKKRSVRVGAVLLAAVAVGVVTSMKSTSMKGSVSSQKTLLPVQACFYTATPVTIINKRLENSGYKTDVTAYFITKDSRSTSPLLSLNRTIKREKKADFDGNAIQEAVDIHARNFAVSNGYTLGDIKCNLTTAIPKIDDDSNNITLSVLSNMPDTISPSQRISYTFKLTNNGQNYANRIPLYFEYNFGYGERHSLFEEGSLPNGCELEKDAGIFGVPLQCVLHLDAGKSQEFTIALTAPTEEIVKDFCGNSLDLKLSLLSYYTTPGEVLIPITAPKISCPRCGNGIKEGNEQCDDNNSIDTDYCKNDCTTNIPPACPVNYPNRSVQEACQGGRQDFITCNGNQCCSYFCSRITTPVCGNGRQEYGEQCDDGNANNSDECNNVCRLPSRNPSINNDFPVVR